MKEKYVKHLRKHLAVAANSLKAAIVNLVHGLLPFISFAHSGGEGKPSA